MDLIVYLFWLFVFGLIIGAVARVLVSGTSGMGVVRTAVAGVLGAFAGGLVVRYLVDPKEDWVGIAIAVLCAAVFVSILSPGRGRRTPG